MTDKQYTKVNMNLELNGKTYYNIKRRSDGFNVCQVCGKYTADEILKELNDLYEENELLKRDCNLLSESHYDFRKSYEQAVYDYEKLDKENEQLKNELKDYHNAFDCSQCRYHNYDWFDDGDEFEVCDKGNNEQQMENHSCKDWEELE